MDKYNIVLYLHVHPNKINRRIGINKINPMTDTMENGILMKNIVNAIQNKNKNKFSSTIE